MPNYKDRNKKSEEFVQDIELEVQAEPTFRPARTEPKKQGIIALVTPTKIIINYEGNGISIPFEPTQHAQLKKGDKISVP